MTNPTSSSPSVPGEPRTAAGEGGDTRTTERDALAAVAEALDRAQRCWDATVGVGTFEDPSSDRIYVTWFIHHVTVVVLLENLRRLDPGLADRLTGWLDDLFGDGYAGELLYQWRQQAAAGQPLWPINPPPRSGQESDS